MNENSVWEKKTLKSLKFKAAAADVILQKPYWGREAEEAGSHAQHLWYYFSLNCYFHFLLKSVFFINFKMKQAFFISWKMQISFFSLQSISTKVAKLLLDQRVIKKEVRLHSAHLWLWLPGPGKGSWAGPWSLSGHLCCYF